MKGDDLFRKAPYSRFAEFIAPGADRFGLLCALLEDCGLPRRTWDIAGKRHLAVLPAAAGAAQPLIFTAHYDRAAGSPGANDNSAAVFQLAETARYFRERSGGAPAAGPWFIFTDGEELSGGEDLRNQGAYSLGLYLRENGLGDARIFTFDACGTGDTLIISTAADRLLKSAASPGAEAIRHKVQALRNRALDAARAAGLERVQLLPTPFSEDAGFLRAGLSAQTITALPQKEASGFYQLVRRGGEGLLSRICPWTSPADEGLIPATWKVLNSPEDGPRRLSPEHWKRITAFAQALGRS